jgi:hypothetical protein
MHIEQSNKTAAGMISPDYAMETLGQTQQR